MSAYLVPKTHVGTLARWATEAGIDHFYNPMTEEHISIEEGRGNKKYASIAKILEEENHRSLGARYGGDHGFGPVRKYVDMNEEAISSCKMKDAEIAYAVRGYEYQACESADWHKSDAFWICQAIKSKILERMSSGEEMWSIEDELLKERGGVINILAKVS